MAKRSKSGTSKQSSRRKSTVTVTRRKVARVRRPVVDQITTTTELETVPKVEVRRPATLAQGLTQPPVAVVKPETKVVSRTVRRKRRVA